MDVLDELIQRKCTPSPRKTLDDGLNLIHDAYNGVDKIKQLEYQLGLQKVRSALTADPSLAQVVCREYISISDESPRDNRFIPYHSISSRGASDLVAHYQLLTDFEKMGVQLSPSEHLVYSSIVNYGAEGLELLTKEFDLKLDPTKIAETVYESVGKNGSAFYERAFDALEYARQMGHKVDLTRLPDRKKLEEDFFLPTLSGKGFKCLKDESEVLKYLQMLKGWGMELVSEETMSILEAKIATYSIPAPQPLAAKAKKSLLKRTLDGFLDAATDGDFP